MQTQTWATGKDSAEGDPEGHEANRGPANLSKQMPQGYTPVYPTAANHTRPKGYSELHRCHK